MHVEAPFCEESPARFILTRARGFGILTFNKIKKTANKHKFSQITIKTTKYIVILSKQKTPSKNDVRIFFMGTFIVLSEQFLWVPLKKRDRKGLCIRNFDSHTRPFWLQSKIRPFLHSIQKQIIIFAGMSGRYEIVERDNEMVKKQRYTIKETET